MFIFFLYSPMSFSTDDLAIPRSRVLDLETSLARRGALNGRQRLGETVEDSALCGVHRGSSSWLVIGMSSSIDWNIIHRLECSFCYHTLSAKKRIGMIVFDKQWIS